MTHGLCPTVHRDGLTSHLVAPVGGQHDGGGGATVSRDAGYGGAGAGHRRLLTYLL
jgi:hypothetical protein